MHRTLKTLWSLVILVLSGCLAAPPPPAASTSTITAITSGPTPTITPLPTLTPLPTPVPLVRIDTGDKALFFGDYDLAREEYLAAFNSSTDRSIQAAALWEVGS